MTIWIVIIVLQIPQWILVWLLYRVRRSKESDYYTDYVRGKLILRVYKPEFESMALQDVERGKLLDQGLLNPLYCWALLER